MGGHLMGQKVTDQVAEMRSLPSGIDQRSPARHPDWLGPDDLALKVQELRELTKNKVPIQLKLGASKVYDDVRMAAKCNPDSIFLDGMEGSTGAGPHIAAANTGIPGIAAIREARRAAARVTSENFEPVCPIKDSIGGFIMVSSVFTYFLLDQTSGTPSGS